MQQNRGLWEALSKIRGSTKGAELHDLLNDSEDTNVIRFRWSDDRRGSHPKCKTGEVVVDPNDIGRFFETVDGFEQFTLERILAHELRHLTGTRDTGHTRMDNINKWENPVMTPIDGFVRDAY